ncbi:MAG TPA: S41 family peptidase [Roseiflexaceae bacterium]
MRSSLSKVLSLQLPIWLVMPMLALVFVLGAGAGIFGAPLLTAGGRGSVAVKENPGGSILDRLWASSSCPEAPDVCARFENFWKTWDLVNEHFVDPKAIDPQRMTDGAIEGMLDSLGDQGHTRYLPPEAAQAERESLDGKFEGIGAYIDVRNDQPLIVQPIEGSPAERAGLRPGDLILKVNGEDVHGVTVEQLRSKVRGPKGTSVTLTIEHEGEDLPIDVNVMREEINVPSVSWRLLADKTALVHLNQFAARSSDEMKKAITDAQAQGATAMVLDLRNNPGGLVNELVGVASQFLPEGTTVLLEQDRAGDRKPYKTSAGGAATTIPLVVLVNNNTASSAEILAGALKDAGRALVIGVPTFGTATVLRTYDLDGGAQVRIGTTQWLTPKGEVVRGKGIQPTELLALPPGVAPLSPAEAARLDAQTLLQSKDVQLVRALAALKEATR